MDVKLIILLGIVTIVRDENDMVVTHGLDDVFQKVSARRHVLQKDPFLELAAVTNHGMEGEGIEHPTSGTSFLEAVAILYVITIATATADTDFKQFLDAMDVVDEGSSGEFRSLTEVRVQPSALDFLQGDAAPFLCPVDGFHEPDIFVQLIDCHIILFYFVSYNFGTKITEK